CCVMSIELMQRTSSLARVSAEPMLADPRTRQFDQCSIRWGVYLLVKSDRAYKNCILRSRCKNKKTLDRGIETAAIDDKRRLERSLENQNREIFRLGSCCSRLGPLTPPRRRRVFKHPAVR